MIQFSNDKVRNNTCVEANDKEKQCVGEKKERDKRYDTIQ